jgi:hypothetical protein
VQQGAQDQGFKVDAVPLKPTRVANPHFVTGKASDVHAIYDFESKELGHGHYGVVRLGTHKTSKAKFAIKTIRKVIFFDLPQPTLNYQNTVSPIEFDLNLGQSFQTRSPEARD